MEKKHNMGIVTAIVSGLLFGFAFTQPFVCSDFGLSIFQKEETSKLFENPCATLISESKTNGILEKTLQITAQNSICSASDFVSGYTYKTLDQLLGTIQSPVGEIDWQTCIEHPEIHNGPISTCCEKTTPIETCFKWKVANKIHLPLGDQYIFGIISLLFSEGHIFLAGLIGIFSVLFPLSKVLLLYILSVQSNNPRLYAILKMSSRWSMTDVFVIGLLMVYFRADRFAFQFHAGIGVYSFALAAILSSIGISLIHQRHITEKHITQKHIYEKDPSQGW